MMILFIDMDGVIADFFSLFAAENNVEHWKAIKNKKKALSELKGTNFFNKIEAFEGASSLISFAKKTKSWGICSSPLRGDKINSIYWKRVWLERHDFMPLHANCIFTHKKEKFAQDGKTKQSNILVDDKLENIERWRIAGGIGVHFQANECSYTDLIDKLCRLAYEHTSKH